MRPYVPLLTLVVREITFVSVRKRDARSREARDNAVTTAYIISFISTRDFSFRKYTKCSAIIVSVVYNGKFFDKM